MEAKELMRFDWVRIADDNTPRQVDWIRSGEVGLFWNKNVTPPYLEPIPLTPEILEKNGFKYQEDLMKAFGCSNALLWGDDAYSSVLIEQLGHYHDGAYNWEGYWVMTLRNQENKVVIKDNTLYVHELQHALRLCEIEKEIVL